MKQFLVIGLGRFGMSLAMTLAEKGYEVLGVDNREGPVQEAAGILTQAVQLDATIDKDLLSVGITNFDVAVVAIGHDIEASILCTLILKEVGIPRIVAKAQGPLHGKVLKKIGADRVVFPERDMGIRVANNLISTNLLDYIDLSDDFSIREITAPTFVVDKTLAELKLPTKLGINIIAIKTSAENINITPGANDVIKSGNVLVVVGENRQLDRLEKM
ncbi:MAG: TrkA family potassium uptake protein [Eubacteriales bacterium]|jgi:trk system potassium uptake protein TrkA|nr:TrkA family potassium uptake protein [Eubacteriales bacterium]